MAKLRGNWWLEVDIGREMSLVVSHTITPKHPNSSPFTQISLLYFTPQRPNTHILRQNYTLPYTINPHLPSLPTSVPVVAYYLLSIYPPLVRWYPNVPGMLLRNTPTRNDLRSSRWLVGRFEYQKIARLFIVVYLLYITY